jgi:hypothetical protein
MLDKGPGLEFQLWFPSPTRPGVDNVVASGKRGGEFGLAQGSAAIDSLIH